MNETVGIWIIRGLLILTFVVGMIAYFVGEHRGSQGTSRWWQDWTGITPTELEQGRFKEELNSLRWMIGRPHPRSPSQEDDLWDSSLGIRLRSQTGKTRLWIGQDGGWELRLAGAEDARALRVGLNVPERGPQLDLMDKDGLDFVRPLFDFTEEGHAKITVRADYGEDLWTGEFALDRLLGWTSV